MHAFRAWGAAAIFLGLLACSSSDEPPASAATGGASGATGGAGGASSGGTGGAVPSGGTVGSGGVRASGGAGGAPACPRFDSRSLPAGVTVLLDTYPFSPATVGIAGGFIYFVDDFKLMRLPVAGGTPAEVATVPQDNLSLVGTDRLLFWQYGVKTDAGTTEELITAPLTNPSDTTMLASGFVSPEYTLFDANHVYFGTRYEENVYRVPLAGGAAPTVFIQGASPLGAIIHDGFYWWLDFRTNSLERIPLGGGTRERLTQVHHGGAMEADANGVYWADRSLGAIEKWTPAGGRQVVTQTRASGLTLADGTLYFSDTGTVQSVKTDGTGLTSILCNLSGFPGVYADGGALLIVSGNGIIRVQR